MTHKVCIFCSSSELLDEIYYTQADELGMLIAKNNMDLVYGGSNIGIMYKVAKSAKDNGAKIYGVMPEKLHNFGVSYDKCDKFYLTKGMRERKTKLDELSDSIIALPGGFGTLEEVSEMIVQKQLGYNNKPIIFLNTNHFYDYLFEFFNHIVENSFAKNGAENLYYIANTPEDAINYILNYDYKEIAVTKEDIYKAFKKVQI